MAAGLSARGSGRAGAEFAFWRKCPPIAARRCAEFAERPRRRRCPDSSPAPHRNSPWSDRRGLAGGADGHRPRWVVGTGGPRSAAAQSERRLGCQPLPHALLAPDPPRVASENSAQSARLRATRSASSQLTGVTAAAADWGARLGLLGPFHPGSHQQTRELPPKTAPALCSDPEGHSRVLEVGLGAVGRLRTLGA